MSVSETFDLDRFLAIQEEKYDGVRVELGAGYKTGHWMWWIFPQAAGLGTSPTAQFYAIASLGEAVAYAAHSVLGARLRACAQLLLEVPDDSAQDILGQVDAMKLRSSMTLFQTAAPEEPLFAEVLHRFFGDSPDFATEQILATWRSQSDEH
ncbi:uncharacterized protein (DUF1810 family) [Arthrobacter sp. UYCu511]|uniref:DUF1810 domain-containing protein n=1 Tax=Arthrobacter sp. UYCu511 TaxID=3156337 RepID=UPI0033974551